MDVQEKLLRSKNLKVTSARKGILELLRKKKSPLDVATIIEYLQKKDIQADQATVYRVLGVFEEEGIVHKVEFQEGKYRYELSDLPHHHHVVCTSCGRIGDIEDCDIEKLEKKVSKSLHFQVATHNLELFGLCASCLKS